MIRLKAVEIEFLKHCNNDILNSYLDKGHLGSKSSSLALLLDKEQEEQVARVLIRILTDRGIGDDGEINDFGKKIDDLVDKFNHYE